MVLYKLIPENAEYTLYNTFQFPSQVIQQQMKCYYKVLRMRIYSQNFDIKHEQVFTLKTG